MFTLISGLVGLVFLAAALVFFVSLGLLIKLAAVKLLGAFVLKATLHGIFPHIAGAILFMMIATLLISATLAGLAVHCLWS